MIAGLFSLLSDNSVAAGALTGTDFMSVVRLGWIQVGRRAGMGAGSVI